MGAGDDKATSAPVRIEPLGITLHCEPGETLINSAWRHGYYWPTVCGGVGDCGACRCEILTGTENLGPETESEAIFFRSNSRISNLGKLVRLACCLTTVGPLTVSKRGVEKSRLDASPRDDSA